MLLLSSLLISWLSLSAQYTSGLPVVVVFIAVAFVVSVVVAAQGREACLLVSSRRSTIATYTRFRRGGKSRANAIRGSTEVAASGRSITSGCDKPPASFPLAGYYYSAWPRPGFCAPLCNVTFFFLVDGFGLGCACS